MTAQAPAQGSTHSRLTQFRLTGQSELIRHSGRQSGAVPIAPDTHEHSARPPDGRQMELGPHGCDWHGLGGKGRKVATSATGLGMATTKVDGEVRKEIE